MLDTQICIEALRLNPELWHATQLASRVHGKSIFPIGGIDSLIEALRDNNCDHCKLDGVTLTTKHAMEYFPTAFFPIEDESTLLKVLYAALSWGKSVHHIEAQSEHHKKSVSMKGGS